jgi:membrane-associated phospholipid phosphatase
MLTSKSGLVVLLLLVFLANYGETWLESSSHTLSPVSAADYKGAYAVQQFEPEFLNFEFHDATARWAMYAYSISYFVVFPVVGLGVLVALARRKELAPFRVLCLAVTADYLVSLPWFLLFPVPERWAYPESNAILLSDLWTSNLIAAIRPISALNNCFPSTHVSLTVIILIACWLFQVRLRDTITALGITVILATFVLGIHWLADIVAGVLVGFLSMAIAWRYTDTSERRELALASA